MAQISTVTSLFTATSYNLPRELAPGFTYFGYSNETVSTLYGGHVALELNAFISRYLSFSTLINTAAYQDFSGPDQQLFHPRDEDSQKNLTGFDERWLWLNSFHFGLTFHL